MKKALIALLALSMIGTAAFAADPAFTVSGDAQLWFGMDLDTGHTGFSNVNDGLEVYLTAFAGSPTKTGEGSYGYITIGNLRLKVDSGWAGAGGDYGSTAIIATWDDVVAKLVFGAASLTFWQAPGADFSKTGQGDDCWLTNAYVYNIYNGKYGSGFGNLNTTHKSWEGTWNDIYFLSPGAMRVIDEPATTMGFSFDYSVDKVASFGLVVKSRQDWTQTANADVYAFKAYASLLAVDGLTLDVAANMDTRPGDDFGLGAKLAYAIKAGDITITPAFAYDMQGAGYGLQGGLRVDMMKSTLTANFGMDELSAWAFTVAANVGMVDGLTLQGAFETNSANTYGISFNLGYAIKSDKITISPFVKGSYDTYGANHLYLKAGADISGLLANTTFMLYWNSGDLGAATPVMGELKAGFKVSF